MTGTSTGRPVGISPSRATRRSLACGDSWRRSEPTPYEISGNANQRGIAGGKQSTDPLQE